MSHLNIAQYRYNKIAKKLIIFIGILIFLYFLISLYFAKHFFFHTVINGVDVSLKSYGKAERILRNYVKDYELILQERNNTSEVIAGQEIDLKFNNHKSIAGILKQQKSIQWIGSLFTDHLYYDKDLFTFDEDRLNQKIKALNCLNHNIESPKNAGFQYIKGYYHIVNEVYGNQVIEDKLREEIIKNIKRGSKKLDLDDANCYENPKYTSTSKKTRTAYDLLNRYVSTKVTYLFGNKKEVLDGDTINNWLSVDEDMEVIINKSEIKNYIKSLSKKYDTIGIKRNFKASSGKIIEVKGGIYGWKINQAEEAKALEENIRKGEQLEKEPIYKQKAVSREENDIGNTYIEINITRQHLWFYKDGKLVTQGAVVTGNPNKGNATVLGVYMVNYKQKDAVLKGPNYEAKVTYWMPFYGNIGLHDASWRSSFGGEIYKSRGTHGCVNAPKYLAKTIFQNIEAGVPIICYEE